MTKNDAIRAMMDGKKVRQTKWILDTYICFDGDKFVGSDGLGRNMNTYLSESHWEIYEEPAPKTKYYRRKWGKSSTGDRLYTENAWCLSKEAFDAAHQFTSKSDEWEEKEV